MLGRILEVSLGSFWDVLFQSGLSGRNELNLAQLGFWRERNNGFKRNIETEDYIGLPNILVLYSRSLRIQFKKEIDFEWYKKL